MYNSPHAPTPLLVLPEFYLIFLLTVVLLAKVEGVDTPDKEEPVEEKKIGRG